MILLMISLTACTDPKDSGLTETETDDTSTTKTTQEEPFLDPDWWTIPSAKETSAVFGEDPTPGAGWQTLFYTSADRVNWVASPLSPLAVEFSSLGIFSNEVALAVTGVISGASLGVPIDLNTVYALTTLDLETWGVRSWSMSEDPPLTDRTHSMVVDPQFELGPESLIQVWFFACENNGEDPMNITGPHDMCIADFTGPETLEAYDCPLQEEEIADPSPWFDTDVSLLATTRTGHIIIWDITTDPVEIATFSGTVPFLTRRDDGTFEVWYQAGNEYSAEIIHMRESSDGINWSDPTTPLGEDFDCTSPVIGYFNNEHVFFCAHWPKG